MDKSKNDAAVRHSQDSPFDQSKFIWLHAPQVFPLVVRVELDTESLSLPVGVDKVGRSEVLLEIDTPEVTEGERPIPSSMVNWTPEVDDLEAMLQQLWNVLGWEMAMDTGYRGLGGLVDMYIGNRLTLVRAIINLAWTTTADS